MSIHEQIAADAKRVAAAVPLIAPLVALVAEYRWIDQEVIDAAIAHECEGWQTAGPSGVEHTMDRLEFQEAAARRVYNDIGIGCAGGMLDHIFDRGDHDMIAAMMRRVGATGAALAGARICRRFPTQHDLPALVDSNGFDRPSLADIIQYIRHSVDDIQHRAAPRELKVLADGGFYAP